jgi:hypothetical protein
VRVRPRLYEIQTVSAWSSIESPLEQPVSRDSSSTVVQPRAIPGKEVQLDGSGQSLVTAMP